MIEGTLGLGEDQLIKENKLLPTGRVVLIFGQGPVIDKDTRLAAETVRSLHGHEDINIWSQDLALAAAELAQRDRGISGFIVMGGPTGGDQYYTEAEGIARMMQAQGISLEQIRKEEASKDTIENLVNFLNLYDSETEDISAKSYDVLCAPYHAVRLRILMKLFAIPVGNVFRSDATLEYSLQDEIDQLDEKKGISDEEKERKRESLIQQLNQLESRTDINNHIFFEGQRGTERRTAEDRFLKDNLWLRELIQFPEKWLPAVGTIKNDQRVKAILAQARELYPDMLEKKYGISEEMEIEQVRQELSKITYIPLTEEQVKEWEENNRTGTWPQEVLERVNKLLGVRG